MSELLDKINAIKRTNRAEDARRLASVEVTPEQLQDENSLWPRHAKLRIVNAHDYIARALARQAKISAS